MPRGGQRQANPAKAGQYANRSDMRTTQPIQTAPGQPYGEAGAQAAAQAQIPLSNGPTTPQQAPQPGMPPGPSPLIGNMGSLFAPTAQPDVPVTNGAALGPGAGPEALQTNVGLGANKMSDMLAAVANKSQSPSLQALAQRAKQLGQ